MTKAFLPCFALTLAITGHRRIPADQADRVRRQLDEVLTSARAGAEAVSAQGRRWGFFPRPPLLRLASCLSEGSDRMAAFQALAAGCKLQAILPFPVRSPVHGLDLPPAEQAASRRELAALCRTAESVLELVPASPPGWQELCADFSPVGQDSLSESFRQRAYLEAGCVMLEHSDILIAVWNGKPQPAEGSTYDMLCRALRRGMPVCLIDSSRDCPVRIVQSPDQLLCPAGQDAPPLDEVVVRRWGLKNGNTAEQLRQTDSVLGSLTGRPVPRLARLWNSFQKFVTRSGVSRLDPGPYREETRPDFLLFDNAANHCAAMHRSSFLGLALMSILAVLSAALASVWPGGETHHLALSVLGVAEAFLLAGAIGNVLQARRRGWQKQLTLFRLAAEVLRLNSFAASLGIPCICGFSEQSLYGDEQGEAWLPYVLRNSLRERGFSSVDMSDAAQISALREDIAAYLIHSQYCYHRRNSVGCRIMAETIEKISGLVFFISLLVVGIRFFCNVFLDTAILDPALSFLGTIGPVLATSSQAVAQYAELKRLSIRSAHLAKELNCYLKQIREATSGSELRTITASVLELMNKDVYDWKEQYNMPDISLS